LSAAVAEMAFSGNLGAAVDLQMVPFAGEGKADDLLLFSESHSRLVLEVAPEYREDVERLFDGVPFACVGRVEEQPELTVKGINGKSCMTAPVAELKAAWKKPLDW